MTRKTEMTKDNKDLTLIEDKDEAMEIIENIIDARKPTKFNTYHIYRMFGFNRKSAAKLTGYKEKTAYSLERRLKDSDKHRRELCEFLDAMPDHYKNITKARLPIISELEGLALEEYRKNPKLLIDKPQLAKQLKQSVGLLGEDEGRPLNIINIGQIQALVHNNHKAMLEDK